ncbi:MAG: hypothetical protein GWN82_20940, partial [Gemmatimonadetes bacterium]|nr:hypothetical protein [Gemmatimonadota bacterium]NIU37450.1 hypothetical protein [Gemmatimonadota bacterium]
MVFLICILAASCAEGSVDLFDVVIEGGRVVDPATGLDGVRSVGIRDGRVAAVSEGVLEGRRTIDAAGLVVAPGFVDVLAGYPNTDEAAEFKIFDGVTTMVSM